MNPIKYFFMLVVYTWLRFDLILYITFRKDWQPRLDFMAAFFGEKDSEKFLIHRGKLAKRRKKEFPPPVLPSTALKKVNQFLTLKPSSSLGKRKRKEAIEQLIFWATDSETNRTNIDSYKTRQVIVESLLEPIFQNALIEEGDLILESLTKIVFSRITYIGSKGEPSPIVHDSIISGVGRILISHFNEVVHLRDEKLDKLTKVKMIKEIQKAKKETGSLAFSGDIDRKNDQFRNKYPLNTSQAKILFKILKHYKFSAWPDSREQAEELIKRMESQLGFDLEETFK